MAVVSTAAIVDGTLRIAKSGMADTVLIVTIPFFIIGITIICVTYITGQAKIDVQMQGNLK